jgi:hypothetical protein
MPRLLRVPRPQEQHCANCRGNAVRQRRHHGRSSLGRQQFRFTFADGAIEGEVTASRHDGSMIGPLRAVDGVVATADAEVAAVLRQFPSLREL